MRHLQLFVPCGFFGLRTQHYGFAKCLSGKCGCPQTHWKIIRPLPSCTYNLLHNPALLFSPYPHDLFMLKSFDPVRSIAVFKFPEPPEAEAPDEPSPVVVQKIDWRAAGLEENEGKVAFIVDKAFTPEDCQKLLKAAEDSAAWSAATVRGGAEDKAGGVIDNYRKSGRILLHDRELADWILSKLKPHLPEEAVEAPTTQYPQFLENGAKDNPEQTRVYLMRLNERLSYLKYVPGDFFGPHYDGGELSVALRNSIDVN